MPSSSELLEKWVILHRECKELVEQVAKCKSRLSYLSSEHADSLMSGVITFAPAKIRIMDDLSSLTNKAKDKQAEMLKTVEAMKASEDQDSCSPPFGGLFKELLKQTELESLLLDKLLRVGTADEDSVVTILCCFTYLPCVSTSMMGALETQGRYSR